MFETGRADLKSVDNVKNRQGVFKGRCFFARFHTLLSLGRADCPATLFRALEVGH